ncbi:MAG: nucleotidyltransferase family protein [Ignavibacteriales bacterium]|nr:nucleotidyltransferase family protein [Ignavibacteriales bacterium]
MDSSVKQENIAIVILAAGGSKRMGSPKQFLTYKGRSLLRHVAEIATKSDATITYVVAGTEVSRIQTELGNLPVQIVENPHWHEGLSSSIRAGISALPNTITAALLMLCDQPKATTNLLNTIIMSYQLSGKLIVACEYGEILGVPTLFDHSLFPALLKLKGDQGAKGIITRYADTAIRIPFPEGAIDIDTPFDYEALTR